MCSRTICRLGVDEMFKAEKRDAVLTRRLGMPSFEDSFGGLGADDDLSHRNF